MEQPKILITGGTGFAGSHLVEALIESGYKNIHVTSFSGKNSFVSSLLDSDRIHKLDITDKVATASLLEKLVPDQIYHLASFAYVGKSFDSKDEVLNNNINLQLSLLNAIKEITPKARLLSVGSAEEYGVSEDESELPCRENHVFRPINPYAVSKITQDMLSYSYHISFGLDLVRVRPFNHIGERQSIDFAVPAFTKQIVAIEAGDQEILKVGNLSAIRDFTDVKDMVKAYILVMNKGKSGEVYNIGSGKGIEMHAIVEKLATLSSLKVNIAVDDSRFRPHDIPKMVADASKIKELGWEIEHEIDETLERIINWYRTN